MDRDPHWPDMWNPRMSMSFTNTKGLLNAPGENNCFLNSAVQVLWHLDVFRRSFRILSGHACMGNSCIFCALKVIFTQFQYSDQTALPPDALRRALAKTFVDQQRFQLGLMDDAAECFEHILLRIHQHIASEESEDMCNARHCISHVKFAMTLVEQVVCQCGATSEPLPFSQMVHYVSASALVGHFKAAKKQNANPPFGQLLKIAASDGDIRNCPSECGKRVQIQKNLMNSPDVVSIGLIWDSDKPSLEHIKDVVRSIGTQIRLSDLFYTGAAARSDQQATLDLVGVVCYYGKHYSTFFFHSKKKAWVSFDDANVKDMGSHWEHVVDKCCRGHYQPLLLLYTNSAAKVISTETAPQKTTMLPGHKHFGQDDSGNASGSSGHSRQRSAESNGSGTFGGQGRNTHVAYETNVKMNKYESLRRALTPDPDSCIQNHTPARRAITPGPEWGRYDSDDEGGSNNLKNPEIVHFRQPSYLQALDTIPSEYDTLGKYQNKQSHQDHPAHRPQNYNTYSRAQSADACLKSAAPNMGYQSQDCVDGSYYANKRCANTSTNPDSHYVSQANGPKSMQGSKNDLLGPLPNHLQYPVSTSYSTSTVNGQVYPAVNSNQPSDWTLTRSDQYGRKPGNIAETPNFVSPTPPRHTGASVAKINEIQKMRLQDDTRYPHPAELAQNGGHYTGGHIDNMSYGQVPVQNQNGHSAAPIPDNMPATIEVSGRIIELKNVSAQPPAPSMKRTKSLEDTQEALRQQTVISRCRPHSARPFDYNNQRPTVDPQTGQVRMASKNKPMEAYHVNNYANQHPYNHPNNHNEHSNMQHRQMYAQQDHFPKSKLAQWADNMGEDNCGTYINRKTVEKLMKSRTRANSIGDPIADNKNEAQHMHKNGCENMEVLELNRKNQQHFLPHSSVVNGILKVDIPDNISLNSYKDSGYRSGGSSGDRNSASSASSMSIESPTVDIHKNYPQYKSSMLPSQMGYDNRSHSSMESLSSNQSQLSSGTVKTLQHQKLGQIPENLPAGYRQDRRGSQELLETGGATDRACEVLCMQAEQLMELSTRKEEEGDLAIALLHCDQAIGNLQEALSIPETGKDSKVHARMKHNACVMRSRSLHRRHLKRQESTGTQSTGSDLSNEDHNSVSSMSTSTSTDTDSRDIRDPDLLNLESPLVQTDHMDFKKKLETMYRQKMPQRAFGKNCEQSNNTALHGNNTGVHSNNINHHSNLHRGVVDDNANKSDTVRMQMSRSHTDGGLSQHVRQERSERVVKTARSSSTSSQPDGTTDCDRQTMQLYGTLPKKKKVPTATLR